MIERGEYIMDNKIMNIKDSVTAYDIQGEEMVEIDTDGYGKVYIPNDDLQRIAPLIGRVKNGMKSIKIGSFDEEGEFVPEICHMSPYYDQDGKRIGDDMVLYGNPENNSPIPISELPKDEQDDINAFRHSRDNEVHLFTFDEDGKSSRMTPIVSLNSVPVMDNKVNDTCCDRDYCCSNNNGSSPRIECIPLNEALVIIKAK